MSDKSVFKLVDYGKIVFDISNIMKQKKLTVNQIVKRTGLHHRAVNKYCNAEVTRYDGETLAKLCFVLDCQLNDIMKYEKPRI